MNKVIVKGRLTNEPTTNFINENMSVTKFSIAVKRKAKKDEEEKADFINITAWNKQGEFIKTYFTKGQEILIVGRLETSQYVDKETQKKITKYEVVAEEVEFVGSKKEKKEEESFDFNESEIPVNMAFSTDDDLPF